MSRDDLRIRYASRPQPWRRATTFRRCMILAIVAATGVLAATAQEQRPDRAASAGPQAQSAVFRAALQTVMPALVRIDTIGGAMPVEQAAAADGETIAASGFRQADGPTTGLICAADGYILTSSFNFVRDPTVITTALADGRRFVARLVARDRTARLALLKIDATGLPVPNWSLVRDWRVGQWVLLAGYGHGGDTPALSAGILSALSRLDGRAVQTDVRASPANYGGPLFDLDGRVIGICVPKAGKGGDEVAGVEWYDSGIGFAIRSDYIEQLLPTLRAGRDFEQGCLGLRIDPADPVVGGKPEERPQGGVGVLEVVPGGPAAQAGLLPGDMITAIDRRPTTRPVDISRILARMPVGQQIATTFRRDGADNTSVLSLAGVAQLENAATCSAPASQPAP
jgi:serine protease Do